MAYQRLKVNMYLSLIFFLPNFQLLEQLFGDLVVNWEQRVESLQYKAFKGSRNIH